jgi:hypothetical protein
MELAFILVEKLSYVLTIAEQNVIKEIYVLLVMPHVTFFAVYMGNVSILVMKLALPVQRIVSGVVHTKVDAHCHVVLHAFDVFVISAVKMFWSVDTNVLRYVVKYVHPSNFVRNAQGQRFLRKRSI